MAENMAEPAMQKKKTSSSSSSMNWTQLPNELLHVISKNLDNCFDVVHARSVCTPWRSAFPFPACLLRSTYSLPTFPIENVGLCSLVKVHVLLFRVKTRLVQPPESTVSEFFFREVTPQCDSTNMVDCQTLSLGHQYKMVCWDPEGVKTVYKHVAFLPLNKERGGEEFAVLLQYNETLLMLTSTGRRWNEITNGLPECWRLVPFRGRFYANFKTEVFVIDPYSLEATLLMPTSRLDANNFLVPSGNDELFLVEKCRTSEYRAGRKLRFRVSRLDEKVGKWVEVSVANDLRVYRTI